MTIQHICDVGLLLAATVVAITVVADRVSTTAEPPVAGSVERVENWEMLLPAGIRVGPDDAEITIVEFGDLECPACRQFASEVREMQREHPEEVALYFIHYPLPQHRFAEKAAEVLECADVQGRSGGVLNALFRGQDSLGLRTWESFAREAGVPSIEEFDSCLNETQDFERIKKGKELGSIFGVRGTPTIIVNGWRIPYDAAFADRVERIRRGEAPAEDFVTRTL